MKELYRFRQFLTEGKLLKEDQKYYSLLNDLRDEGLLNKSGISGLQSKFNLSKEKAKEIFDEYLEDLKAEQPDAFDFFMKDLAEGKLLKEEVNYHIELLTPEIAFNVESGELADSPYEFGTEDEIEDGEVDVTTYTDADELDEFVFGRSYNQAKYFEKEHPGLFKVVIK